MDENTIKRRRSTPAYQSVGLDDNAQAAPVNVPASKDGRVAPAKEKPERSSRAAPKKTFAQTASPSRMPTAKAAAKAVIGAVAKTNAKPSAKTAASNATALANGDGKAKKLKLVKDRFNMPKAEHDVLGQLKQACLQAGFSVKKSELLRLGVALAAQLDIASLRQLLEVLPPVKSDRRKIK